MLPLRAKIAIGIIGAITQIFAYIVAMRNWYMQCMQTTPLKAMLVLFWPVVVGVAILIAWGAGLLPAEFTDEVYTIGSLIGTAMLLFTAWKQVRGKCGHQGYVHKGYVAIPSASA